LRKGSAGGGRGRRDDLIKWRGRRQRSEGCGVDEEKRLDGVTWWFARF
jgi:hypothetical protein